LAAFQFRLSLGVFIGGMTLLLPLAGSFPSSPVDNNASHDECQNGKGRNDCTGNPCVAAG
jgi:hypothetical protein